MRIEFLILGLLTLLEFSMIMVFAVPDEDVFRELSDPKVVFTYGRLSEVEEHCGSFLSSASELKPDDDKTGYTLTSRLSFINGEWHQDAGGLPLMPYDDIELPSYINYLPSPLKLASFEVQDVSSVQHFRNAVTVGGTMLIGVSRESSFVHRFITSPNIIRPGTSALTLAFEGIYVETEENGGERCLCLLGNSTVPNGIFLEGDPKFPARFGLMEIDDQILLVLRYPLTSNFTKRFIRGEMRSLDERTNGKYFDTVYISSHLNGQLTYQYSSKLQTLATCDPKLYHNEILEDGFQAFSGSDFCESLFPLSLEPLSFLTNYKFGGRYLNGSELGYLLFGKEIEEAGLRLSDFRLIMHHVHCDPDTSNEVTGTANVAVVFRAILPGMDPFVARTLEGPSGTLYAEGTWNASSGQLCMVGCPGGTDPEVSDCTSRISLYFPRAFSIKQRSVVFGGISSLRDDKSSRSNFHLLFDLVLHPSFFKDGCNSYSACYFSYNYTKLSEANAFRKRTGKFQFLTDRSHSFSRYPMLKDGEESFSQLYQLSKDLRVQGYAAPYQLSDGHARLFIEMEVLSLGPLVGGFKRYSSGPASREAHNIKDLQLFNVSSHLTFKEGKEELREYTTASYKNISYLFLEGLYDSVSGQMHLMGCRKCPTSSCDTERGLDCLIEVKIQYPDENIQWMANPVTRITITSQRNQDDPLYFLSVTFHTSLTHYHDQYVTVAYRKTFAGVLNILFLLALASISLSQINYMKKHTHVVPYTSLLMVALLVLDYCLQLICGNEILLKLKESNSSIDWSYVLPWFSVVSKVLDYAGGLLLLLIIILTARIFLMVSQSRSKLLGSSNKRHLYVSRGKPVTLITVATYTFVFLIRQVIFKDRDLLLHPENDTYRMRPAHQKQMWMTMLADFGSMVQDLFLFPQILSNLLGQKHAKSLRKTYYLGISLVRVILHLYDFSKDPILDFKFQEYLFETPNEASANFDNIVLATVVIMLATILHFQQNRKLKKPTPHLHEGSFGLQPLRVNNF